MTAATLHIRFNEAEVKRLAEQPDVRQVRDLRYPALLLRFNKNRARASWHIVRHVNGKSPSTKLGNWPDLSVKTALELLPKKLAELTADPSAAVTVAGWSRVSDLLHWYGARSEMNRGQSKKWKDNVSSLLACQLLPRVGSLELLQVDRSALDERLIWPMQEVHSLSYTRQAFGLLKVAFKQAAKLKKLTYNPLGDVVFSDFTDTPIRPKPCALRPHQLGEIIGQVCGEWERPTPAGMLALMMLCHGTRISETRTAKWKNIDLAEGGEWFIPAEEAKTRTDLRLPLTRHTLALLKAYRSSQRACGYVGAYLFPRGDGEPWTSDQAQDRMAAFSLGEWSAHDLRKVARSMWADLGVDYLIGEMLLNHALSDLDAAYIHTHAQALKRDALERWHVWLESRGLPFFATETTPGRAVSAIALEPVPGAALAAV